MFIRNKRKFVVCTALVHFIVVMNRSTFTYSCSNEELSKCVEPLSKLTSKAELKLLTNKHHLEQLCLDLLTGVSCVKSFTRRCMDSHQRQYFNAVYQGLSEIILDLCENNEYTEAFLKHIPCTEVVEEEFAICERDLESKMKLLSQVDPTQISFTNPGTKEERNVNSNIKTMCCSFEEYKNCVEDTVLKRCGSDTAKFTTKFIEKISYKLIQMHCKNNENLIEDCYPSNIGTKVDLIRNLLLTVPVLLLIINHVIVTNVK